VIVVTVEKAPYWSALSSSSFGIIPGNVTSSLHDV
jgi:hypothetical protein